MRDTINDMCTELMDENVIDLFVKTANNQAGVEPGLSSVKLNPESTCLSDLQKYTFIGFFLGWSTMNKGALNLDLCDAFWSRVCGGPDYVYTLEDLKSMDVFRYRLLTDIKSAGEIS